MMDPQAIPQYLTSIADRGFVVVPDAFDPALIGRINETIEEPFNRPAVNGQAGFIRFENARFLSHALTWSRDIINLYTTPALIQLADSYAGSEVHLSNYRIYRSFPSTAVKMHWHVDNKIDTYDAATGKFSIEMVKDDKGLIMIMYLSDVVEGGLQIVEGSHLWSFKENRESWNDREKDFAGKTVTFNNLRRGSAIFYDYRCIHRAQPFSGDRTRTSVFAQFSPQWMPAGEPVILNARDIANLDETQKRVLNFGSAPTTANWPVGVPGELFSGRDWLKAGKFLFRRKVRNLLRGELKSVR